MNYHRFSKEEILICRRLLLAWYDANKRKLPWRDWHDVDINIVAYRGAMKHLFWNVQNWAFEYSFSFRINASTNPSGHGYSIL